MKRIRLARQKSDEDRTRLGRQVSKSDDEVISKIVKPKIKIDRQRSVSEFEKDLDEDSKKGLTNKILEESRERLCKEITEFHEKLIKLHQKIDGKGLKIITPNQLLTRLPILLAKKKVGNNSQKLNNEIRQIIYSLYSSKNMSKTVTNNHVMNNL